MILTSTFEPAPTRDTLNDVMQFDCVTQILSDGTVGYVHTGLYAPDVSFVEPEDRGDEPDVDTEIMDQHPWVLLTGHSNQYRYTGPIFHESEFIGGGLADHILATPGYYVVVEVRESDGNFPDASPIGWAIAHIPEGVML